MQPWQLLKAYVNSTKPDNDLFIQACWDEAQVLVDLFIVGKDVPDVIYTRAIKEVGANLYRRRGAYDQGAGVAGGYVPLTPANDPMTNVYPMLRPWVGWF